MTRPDVTAMADLDRHELAAREAFRPVRRKSELAGAREAGDRLLAARMRHHGITRAENA